ncbi:hypothetical protein FRC11_001635 [Ceratobasidium sp. 423]|nr:hypothetical protein FRC11_001635 [Ceratobasidium sp. 423]
MTELAAIYSKQGQWTKAETLQQRVVHAYEHALGAENPDTLRAMTELAAIYSEQGQWTKAETLQQRVVHRYKHALGAENPDTLRAMAALAITCSRKHNWAEAETLQGHVVGSYGRILGTKHPDTLKAMSELAVIHSKQDHWGKAEPLQEHVLSSYEQTSHKHRDMMAILTGLIVTYSKKGRSDRATTLLNHARDQCKQVLNKQKSGTQISIVKYGVFHLGRRLARKAELQERILDIHVQLLGDHNLDTESDVEIMTILLAYLEAHAWFLHSPESLPALLLEESLGGLKFKIDEIDRLREIVRCRTGQVEGNKASSEDPLKAPHLPSVPSIPLANSNKTTRDNRTTGDNETTNKGTVNGSVGSAPGMALKPTSPTPGPGTLKVTLHRAKDLARIEKGDIAKPFVILRIGDKDHKSKHVKSNTPEWNESFSFPNVLTNTRTLHVAIKDKRTFGKDPTLAKGTIDIWCYIQLLSTPPILSAEVTAQLDDHSGTLQLRLDFEPMQNTLKITPPSRFRLNQLYSKEKKLP